LGVDVLCAVLASDRGPNCGSGTPTECGDVGLVNKFKCDSTISSCNTHTRQILLLILLEPIITGLCRRDAARRPLPPWLC
jgi:hypothetical protein